MIIGANVQDVYPFYRNGDGGKSWTRLQGDKYHVTGVDVYGRRIKVVTDIWQYAKGVNVYRGSRWLVRGGRRYLIERVYN